MRMSVVTFKEITCMNLPLSDNILFKDYMFSSLCYFTHMLGVLLTPPPFIWIFSFLIIPDLRHQNPTVTYRAASSASVPNLSPYKVTPLSLQGTTARIGRRHYLGFKSSKNASVKGSDRGTASFTADFISAAHIPTLFVSAYVR